MTQCIRWAVSISILAASIIFATLSWTDTGIRADVPITVDHASGTTSVSSQPQKVVVFDLASLDNLERLGVKAVVGVPEGKKPAYLGQFDDAQYEKIGTLFEPNYEKIASLQPDLIIISARAQPKYADLSKIAPTVDLTVGNSDSLKDIERNLTILGKIFGKEKEAEQEIAKLSESLAAVREKAKGKGKALILMTSGGQITAFGPKSRFDILHSAFGITPATDKLTVHKHGQPISLEFILKVNPDWLLVIDRDAAIGREGESAEQLLNNALIKRTTAGKQNQIIYLDSWSWYRASGGLTGLHEAIQQVGDAFTENTK